MHKAEASAGYPPTLLDAITRVESRLRDIVDDQERLSWQHTLSMSSRFPFSYYAALVSGDGLDAEELVVISIEIMRVPEGRLVATADITTGKGVLLAHHHLPDTMLDGDEQTTATIIAMATWTERHVPLIEQVARGR